MSKKNISYIKQDDPSFLQQFKQKIGYVEGPTVDSKRPLLSQSDESGDEDDALDADDEKPVVVVLKAGDLTADEAERLQQQGQDGKTMVEPKDSKKAEDNGSSDGKIIFKKPVKRSSTEGINAASSKKKKDSEEEVKKQDPPKNAAAKQVKNVSLLSFDADEDEDED